METKGLRVNMAKTKVLKCQSDSCSGVSSGKWPCGVCKKGVGSVVTPFSVKSVQNGYIKSAVV